MQDNIFHSILLVMTICNINFVICSVKPIKNYNSTLHFPSAIGIAVSSAVSGLFSSKVSARSLIMKESAKARLGGMIEQSLLK